MHALKIRAVGSSSGVVLSKDLLAEWGVKQGDTLYATRGPEGSIRLTRYDDTFARQMAIAEEIMHEHRDVLRELSKR